MPSINIDSPSEISYATYPLSENERRHKFDTKNELGLYLGDKQGMKSGCHVYQPFWHRIITRGDVHRIKISEVELMEWYGKRAYVRQSGLGWGQLESAMLDISHTCTPTHPDQQ